MRKTTLAYGVFLGLAFSVPGLALELVGTGDGMAQMQALADAFSKSNPDSVIKVPPSIGSGGGIAAVGSGKAIIGRVARPLKQEEKAAGIHAEGIFRLPSAIYVHRDLPVRDLSYRQLLAIYEGSVTRWSDVGGPDARIRVVRREDTDSTLSVLRKSMPGWDDARLTERAKTAVTTQEAVEIVSATPGSIGFGPYSTDLDDKVRVLKIAGNHPTNDGYPSFTTISYIWKEPLTQQTAKAFVKFSLTTEAAKLLAGYGAISANASSRARP